MTASRFDVDGNAAAARTEIVPALLMPPLKVGPPILMAVAAPADVALIVDRNAEDSVADNNAGVDDGAQAIVTALERNCGPGTGNDAGIAEIAAKRGVVESRLWNMCCRAAMAPGNGPVYGSSHSAPLTRELTRYVAPSPATMVAVRHHAFGPTRQRSCRARISKTKRRRRVRAIACAMPQKTKIT